MWAKQQYETCKSYAYRYAEKYLSGVWWFNNPDKVAKFTGWVAFFTLALAITAGLQTCILDNQLNEMRDEQRPWLSVQGFPASGLSYTDKGQPTLTIVSVLKNIGRRPAQYVASLGQFFPWIIANDPITRRDKMCEELRTRHLVPENQGFVMMPGDTKTPLMKLYMQPADIEAWKKATIPGGAAPVIAFCLDYVFVSDMTHHHVGLEIEVDKRGTIPNQPIAIVQPTDTNIPQSDLMLNINPALPWDIN